MRKPVSVTCLLLAWLCAQGAVCDVAQVVAWSRMFAGYAEKMSVSAALRETFNPEKPCELCLRVSSVRHAEQQQTPAPLARADVKLDLVCETPAPIVFVRQATDWPSAFASAAPSRREAVPVPPPRV